MNMAHGCGANPFCIPIFVWFCFCSSCAWGVSPDSIGSSETHSDEQSVRKFFYGSSDARPRQHVARYTDLTTSQFERLALRGRPFVIEKGGSDQPFVGWTCKDFKRAFPNGVVQLQYARGQTAERPITDRWEDEKHKIPEAGREGPKYAPWYWGVKGAYDAEDAAGIFHGGENPLDQVQERLRVPSYMSDSEANRDEVLGSPEFWFSRPGAGAALHMDAHCESTLAIQLSGERKWLLGWAPAVPNGTIFKEGTYADGAMYGKDYEPPLEAVVKEGDALFMPSGFLHSTENVGDTCAASLTVQFKDPIPGRYFRHAMKSLRRTGDFGECWGFMGKVASVFKGTGTPDSIMDFSSLDKNQDDTITFDEVSTPLGKAAHAFYDVDEDGEVSLQEFADGWLAWRNVVRFAKKSKERKPNNFAYLYETRLEESSEL